MSEERSNEDRSAFTPEVRERLVDIINDELCPVGVTTRIDKKAVQAALDHIDALEARRNELVASLSTLDAWEKIKLLERAEQAEEREAALEARVAELDEAGKGLLNENVDLAAKVAVLGEERDDWRADALVLAAECRATRSWTDGRPEGRDEVWWGGDEWGHMMNARAATDAAGALEGGRS